MNSASVVSSLAEVARAASWTTIGRVMTPES
jgi:hypothetical protein